jgi:anaphase-promoting complex subunit 4
VLEFDIISTGLFIALAHDPPRVTIHSVQDGREQRSLVLPSLPEPSAALERLWWFPAPQPFQDAQIPDVFQRNGIVVRQSLSPSP